VVDREDNIIADNECRFNVSSTPPDRINALEPCLGDYDCYLAGYPEYSPPFFGPGKECELVQLQSSDAERPRSAKEHTSHSGG
jgi:hypothetical protein